MTTQGGHSPDFMQRILDALDCDMGYLAKRLDIPLSVMVDVRAGSRLQIIAVDHDEMWVKIADYIDVQLGMMMAVREELNRKLALERKARAAHRNRITRR